MYSEGRTVYYGICVTCGEGFNLQVYNHCACKYAHTSFDLHHTTYGFRTLREAQREEAMRWSNL